ncbi:glycosyltransferase [Caenispirillum salinarum]|uniref:glycosyltransferase n=1 Tax=Caenispirillum salinarum TaxID=859058 RepID=UPI00384BFE18
MKDDGEKPGEDRPPVHVLHVITSLDVGGAERMLVKIVAALRGRFRFTVVGLKAEGALADELRKVGADVISLNMRGARDLPIAVFRLRRVIRAVRPDVVQSWLYHADLVGTLALATSGIKARLIWNIRCSDMDFSQYARSTALIVRILTRFSRGVGLAMVNSDAGRRMHEKIGYRPRRWLVVPNGFDISRFRPDPDARQAVRDELLLAPDAKLVGLINRYDQMKDHATFLSAAKSVAERWPDVHFLLAGRGVTTDNPEIARHPAVAQHAARFHLLGERKDVPRLMAALDLFALSSAFGEGFPNVVGEAMACGVPCVVTDVGDAPYIVGETGAVVPRRAPRDLAAAIERFLAEDPPLRRERGVRARRKVEECYSIDVVSETYSQIYRGSCSPP